MNKNLFINEIKSINEEQMTIDMIGSTNKADRVGDVMKIEGIDIKNYLKNPVILQNHDYSKPAIGKALSVKVENGKLMFKIQFANTEEGREWFYLYKNGFMSASSIGFIGKEYELNKDGGLTFFKSELLELSLVAVPCNPEAVIQLGKSLEEQKISEEMYKALCPSEKAGAVISKKNKEKIKEVIDILTALIQSEEEVEEKSLDTPEIEEEDIEVNSEKNEETEEETEEENEENEEAEKNKTFNEVELNMTEIVQEIIKNLTNGGI